MIARHWKAVALKAEAENYVTHLREDTFPHLRTIDGFIRAYILQRDVEIGEEFIIITVWQSLDVIVGFAGEDIEAAVVPDKVRAMMVEFEDRVRHYEVREDFSIF